jgi:uncharacterized protein (DUF111 family)
MMLGALVDAGAPLGAIQAAVDCLDIEPVTITQEAVTRNSLGATKIWVDAPPSTERRTWNDVRDLLERADLDERVKELAIDAFLRIRCIVSTGLGAGSRDTDGQPNVLRVVVGESLEPSGTSVTWYPDGVESAAQAKG